MKPFVDGLCEVALSPVRMTLAFPLLRRLIDLPLRTFPVDIALGIICDAVEFAAFLLTLFLLMITLCLLPSFRAP